ncbi:hypothetical protein FSP39_010165 [Pinctada imbricata]|uniref:Cytochrome P450 2U1 n=1 Tax=Pinctada imbricata TaxID=66713 RepID=A0AA88XF93_PINIB|nr:hypothetical protein FSP39_010165 [Pinctada imbricata]
MADICKYIGKIGDITSCRAESIEMSDICKYIGKTGDVTSCRAESIEMSDICKYIGIAGSSGRLWKEQRTFALSTLRDIGLGNRKMEEKILKSVNTLVEQLLLTNGQPFDISPLLLTTVSNVICSVAFGKRFEHENEQFKELTKCVSDTLGSSEIVGILTFLPFLKYIPGDPLKYGKVMQNEAKLSSFLQDEINEHKKSLKDNDTNNYLDAFLKQQKKEIGQNSTFTDAQLLRSLTDLFVAGTDSTATALRWFLLALLHKPEIQDRMHTEIKDVVGNDGSPSSSHRSKLVYCESVLHEVLRFGNIAPLAVPHGLTEDLCYRGYIIPKDAMLFPNLDSIMNDPALFENPEDFIPSRFLTDDGHLTGTDKVQAFGVGRRICIGESLARMELFLFATALVQRFKFLPPEEGRLPSLSECHIGETRSPLPFKLRAIPRSSRRRSNWPPGPPTLPFVGNLNLISKVLLQEFRRLRRQYGDVFSLVLGSQTVVVINGHETMREIFIKRGDITSCRAENIVMSDICKYIGKRFGHENVQFKELTKCVSDILGSSEIVGILTFLPFLKYIPGDPLRYGEVMKKEAKLSSFLQDEINEHKTSLDNNDTNNYLDAFLKQQKKEIGQDSTFTDAQLLRCLTDLFVTGTDTTGTALRWFLLVLLHKPEIQERIHTEIEDVVGNDGSPSSSHRSKLVYCESVLHEVLRIGNIAPLSLPNGLSEDLYYRGYIIPKDAMLFPNLDSIMNDSTLFENPEDFIPTRFLTDDGRLTGTDKVQAFGVGRRICMGESLARMELFLFATALVQRFQFLPQEEGRLPSLSECHIGETRSPLPFKLRAIPRS